MQNGEIVIVGGLGKTGGRVHIRLKAPEIAVRSASRSTVPAFDWADRKTWAPALQGATAAYVTYQPDLAVPRAAEDIAAFAAIAYESGVRHIVLLSGRGEDGAVVSEGRLKASGIDYTILRGAWFDQNFNEGPFLDGIAAGALVLPAGDIGEPFVHLDDIADVAVAVLTDPRHRRQTYELTGPRLLTFAEAVAEIAAGTGRDIQFVSLPFDAFQVELRAAGLPEEGVWLMDELFTRTLDGRNARVMDGVQQVLGRPPQDFADYVRDVTATNVWRV